MLTRFELTKEKATQRKAQTNNEDKFQALLNKSPEAALDVAIQEQSEEHLSQALKAGASLETASRSGLTRMHQAAKNGRLEEVRFLQQMGANVNPLSKTNETPLLFALEYDHGATIELLASFMDCDPTLGTKKGISPLSLVLNDDNVAYIIAMMKNPKVKASLFIDKFKSFIKPQTFEKASALLDCQPWLENLTQDERKDLLDHAVAHDAPLALIQKLFYSQKTLFDIPFAKLINKMDHFDAKEKIEAFLNLDELLSYIESHGLASPVILAALNVLQQDEHVKSLDAILDEFGNEEDAMGDKKVKHANRHFKEIVEPYLRDRYLSYSRRKDKQQALSAIEQEIRELILNEISAKAKELEDKNTINFIKKNRRSLILGGPKAMEAAVGVFKALTPEQAAWRGYNPFALVKGEWDNLLTPTDTDDIWKTQAATDAEKLSGEEASNTVRERVAYYFLAVCEGDDEALKRNRVVNFIQILAEIRNAKGIDNPSCFPGTLTRAAQMGAFHDIAQLPPTFEEKLAELMRAKVLALFKERLALVGSLKEKRDLLEALIGLTLNNALDVIKDQSTYPAVLLSIRQSFIEGLGSPIAIFDEVKEALDYEVDNEELICVNQALLDPARGDIALMLEEYFNKQLDSIPNEEEKAQANPFAKEELKPYQAAAIILACVEKHVPAYFQSKQKLLSLSSFIHLKLPTMLSQGINKDNLGNFFDSLDGAAEVIEHAFKQCLAACETNGLIEEKAPAQNPYLSMIATLKGQIKHMLQASSLKLALEARLTKAEQKAELFEEFWAKLEKHIQEAGDKLKEAPIFIKEITEHVFEHKEVKMAAFEESLSEPSHRDFMRLEAVRCVLEPKSARVRRIR